MLLETLNQGYVFLIFLFFGMLLGVANFFSYCIIRKFNLNFSNVMWLNKILKVKNTKNFKLTKKQKFGLVVFNVLLCFLILLNFIIFYLICYFFNYGKIRIFEILSFIVGIILTLCISKKIKIIIIKNKLKKFFLAK